MAHIMFDGTFQALLHDLVASGPADRSGGECAGATRDFFKLSPAMVNEQGVFTDDLPIKSILYIYICIIRMMKESQLIIKSIIKSIISNR